MRFLHTSDWHLGQKLLSQSREGEQAAALDWLLEVVDREQVEILIVAGDIYDVGNPPVSAEDLYYNFLARLSRTCCRQVIITGGNHDSPAQLNAPRGVLKALKIHVVGATTGQLEDELIPVADDKGVVQLVVLAVPFLRDRDFEFIAGEAAETRINRIQEGIVNHYELLTELAQDHYPDTRLIATGHLYAKSATATEEQHNIYIGNLENIAAEQFPKALDYIALGHIHRAQKVGKQERIRYCGSMIPLSFSEISDQKGVLLVDIDPVKGLQQVTTVQAPVFRRLIKLTGELTEVELKLQKINQPDDPFPAWIEVVVTGAVVPPNLAQHLREQAAGLNLDILKVRHERALQAHETAEEVADLTQLTPEEVFLQRCASKGIAPESIPALTQTFDELKNWMNEQDLT